MASSTHDVHWIRKEVAMAAIAFSVAHQTEQVGERLTTVLTLLRRMLDAFVSYRMRLAASEAEHARPRQLRITSSQPNNGQWSPCS
jgi:hypothetical protein